MIHPMNIYDLPVLILEYHELANVTATRTENEDHIRIDFSWDGAHSQAVAVDSELFAAGSFLFPRCWEMVIIGRSVDGRRIYFKRQEYVTQ